MAITLDKRERLVLIKPNLATKAKNICTEYTPEDNRCLAALAEIPCKVAFGIGGVLDPKSDGGSYALTACGLCLPSEGELYQPSQCAELQSGGNTPMLRARFAGTDSSNPSSGMAGEIVGVVVIVALAITVGLVALVLALKFRKSRLSSKLTANQG